MKKVAEQILTLVGGSKNVSHLEHCSTRLRFTLIDNSKVDVKGLNELPEVLGVNQTGQTQIIIGSSVLEVYNEIEKILSNIDETSDNIPKNGSSKKKFTTVLLDFIISIFQPLVSAIAGGGILKSLLMLFNMVGILNSNTQTYQILNFVGDAPLYFLPILVAITTAKKLKVNQLVAVSAVAALLTPNLAAMITDGAQFLNFNVQSINYAYQVFPSILCILCYSQLEKFFNKISPKVIRIFFVPMMSLLIVVPLTLLVLGPIGYNLGQGFAAIIMFIFAKFGWIAVAILAAVLPFMVATGMHKAMIPYVITSLSQTGKEVIYDVASLAHNISESGACFAVSIKTKDKKLQSTAISAGISALFGITEPALYGVTILYKRVLYGVMIGSFIGGAALGLMSVEAYVAVGPGVASLSMFISETLPKNFLFAVIGLIISFVTSFISVFILWKEPALERSEEKANEKVNSILLGRPIIGKIVRLEDVEDEVFSKKILGEGLAIVPEKGELYAPIDGVIEMIYETKHALGMKNSEGVEILFHIGIDTVNLNGKHFKVMVEEGQKVLKGDLLLKFNLEGIKEDGFDPTSMMIVTNPRNAKFNIKNEKNEKVGDDLLSIEEGRN